MFSYFEGPTADNVWQQIVEAFRAGDDVLVQPSRGGNTKEILHAAITIDDPRQRWVASRQSPLNIAFAFAELVWIMTGRNDLAFMQAWNKRLPDYVGKGPKLHGAYGYRLRQKGGVDQLTRVYQSLSSNPNTRQAVLQIWDSSVDLPQSDGSPANQDIPCNVLSLLKVRAGKLEWLQVIRSNDLFLGIPYDFVQFTSLQEVMAGWLGIDCGAYHQVSDSLHIYDRDEESVLASALLRIYPQAPTHLPSRKGRRKQHSRSWAGGLSGCLYLAFSASSLSGLPYGMKAQKLSEICWLYLSANQHGGMNGRTFLIGQ